MAEQVSQDELEALLEDDADDVRVVDIRSPSAYRRGHIPGSVNIPFDALAERVTELDGADRVVTVCPKGEASVQAARLIAAYEGFDGEAASLACGVTGWTDELAGEEGRDAEPDADAAGTDPDEAETDAPF